MKKYLASLILILGCINSLCASPADSVSTVYKDGEFKSHYQTKVKASDIIASEVANDLLKDLHSTPNHLFNWAFKDLGLQDKKKNEIIFVFKSSTTDAKTGITHGEFDIIVPLIKTFNNIGVDAIVSKTKYLNGEMRINANIIYSSLLLKYALGTITIIQQKNNQLLFITNIRIKFGWFFNIFITKKRYKSIVEWRIKKFTENLKSECERRQHIVSGH